VFAEAETPFIIELFEVNGHRCCEPMDMSLFQRRNEMPKEEKRMCYLVRGKFGRDTDDDGVIDTRWVPLADLVEQLDDQDELDELLAEYETGLHKCMLAQRAELRV